MDQHSSIGILDRDTHGGGTKEVIRVTVILSVLTIVELILGFAMMHMADGLTKHLIKGTIIILMLAKAFYIVGYFMHLKHEVKNMIMTIVVPLLLFVWFITAFLWDGNSFNELKNNYNRYYESRKTEKAVIKEEKAEEPKKETEQ
jgi:cytochrome c oxidase subunit IV